VKPDQAGRLLEQTEEVLHKKIKLLPWKPWKVLSMACGERFSHLSSMSMARNA
jgi:hypothetical protein